MKIYSYKKGSISYEKNLIQALDIDLEKDKIIWTQIVDNPPDLSWKRIGKGWRVKLKNYTYR